MKSIHDNIYRENVVDIQNCKANNSNAKCFWLLLNIYCAERKKSIRNGFELHLHTVGGFFSICIKHSICLLQKQKKKIYRNAIWNKKQRRVPNDGNKLSRNEKKKFHHITKN